MTRAGRGRRYAAGTMLGDIGEAGGGRAFGVVTDDEWTQLHFHLHPDLEVALAEFCGTRHRVNDLPRDACDELVLVVHHPGEFLHENYPNTIFIDGVEWRFGVKTNIRPGTTRLQYFRV